MIQKHHFRLNHYQYGCALALCASVFTASSAMASESCTIRSDASFYEARKQQAIVLVQYGDQVLRATGGKIRCAEDNASARLVCSVEGQGEILVEGADRAPSVVTLSTDEMGEVHVYSGGDLSCGLAKDFGNN